MRSVGVDCGLAVIVAIGIEDRWREGLHGGYVQYGILLMGSMLPRTGIGFTSVDSGPTSGRLGPNCVIGSQRPFWGLRVISRSVALGSP